MIKLPKLPEEVWKLIFEYLNGTELLNVTKVCRNFHEIVNKSTKLAGKLTLNFEKRKNYGRIGRRRYSHVKIEYIDPAIHNSILKFIGRDITKLEFCVHNFKLDSIRQILMLCENVKILKFRDIQRLHGTQEVTNWLKIPNYKNIQLYVEQCDPRIFKILKNVQVRTFCTTCVEFAHRQYFVDLVEILASQVELEELVLAEFMGSIVGLGLVLFSNDSLSNVKFRLKKLHLKSNQLIPYGNISSVQFFNDFMNLHKDTLEDLQADMLQDFDFSSYVTECKVLKKLSIGIDMRFSSKMIVDTVEQLEIEHVRMNLLKSFPNLKEVRLLNSWMDQDDDLVKWSLLRNCKYLEKIEIEDVPLDDFPSLPSVKSMKFLYYPSIKSEVFARNPQIEELMFVECKDMWTRKCKVLKIIIDYMTSLKSLKIVSRSKIDQSAMDYVRNKCTNLKYFNVYKDQDCHVLWM
ncbi:uncharacterized protein [Chironomus tepperi]|uniref:uncharacterized protein n=1 Tax=Chironomus tepperi TaxID=113505 RepID=UPI00391F6DE1